METNKNKKDIMYLGALHHQSITTHLQMGNCSSCFSAYVQWTANEIHVANAKPNLFLIT